MKVCDRHPSEKAADSVSLLNDDTRADLCVACVQIVREFLSNPEQKLEKPRRGRPPKN